MVDITLQHQAEAIVARHKAYKWYNRPRYTQAELDIMRRFMEQKLLMLANRGEGETQE
jgi:hypothetical protein